MNNGLNDEQRIAESNRVDALMWVASNAKAIIMSGYTGPGHERLRAALKAFDDAVKAQDRVYHEPIRGRISG